MRFFLDHDVYAITARFLRGLGHDVITAGESGHSQAADAELLEIAQKQERILVTRDRDYGNLVFVTGAGSGVVYLRLLPSNLHAVHNEMEDVLTSYSEDALKKAFVVIEPGRHRFRQLP